MQTHILGYPRIGSNRELKKACESYWSGTTTLQQLLKTGEEIKLHNWKLQQELGVDLIPCNDFSYYDQVLDMALTVGAIPDRYHEVILDKQNTETDLYFAMARGYQKKGLDITAMEMTKWFDTNYHYLVPEFYKNQQFNLFSSKIINEYREAKRAGINTKPVILGPVSFLLLGKEKESGFHRIDLLDNLLPVYVKLLTQLEETGIEYVQFDEPCLATDLSEKEQQSFQVAYSKIKKQFPHIKVILANYFDCYGNNLETALSLPVHTLHLDVVRCPSQLKDIFSSGKLSSNTHLSLGIIDGRNIWINDFQQSLLLITDAIEQLGENRISIATSCSLLHVPCDLDAETNEKSLTPEIKRWLAFAKQKVEELVTLKKIIEGEDDTTILRENNAIAIQNRKASPLIHNYEVKQRVAAIANKPINRNKPFEVRKTIQKERLRLPLFPITTIGSFPQTHEVRSWRANYKKGNLTEEQYVQLLKEEIKESIKWQESTNIDVLVHGEFERNDMVEYFGEQLSGFAFTKNGWVQSYGSRCVKPPIIYGDVHRPKPMTVGWTTYAQSLTKKLMKGMLTGPVTILQWSFVRNDQPRSETTSQIALAIQDEVLDLEKAGIKVIQIDEPAIREGLPLKMADWKTYLNWAIRCFRISYFGVKDETQIHTHMCYSEFNDIIENIAAMDADVITIETSRSQMELLDAFVDFNYPNDIGPGVYDIHSPRVPSKEEMVDLLEKAIALIPAEQIWVNPDCGLKTRHWEETKLALTALVDAAQEMRKKVSKKVLI